MCWGRTVGAGPGPLPSRQGQFPPVSSTGPWTRPAIPISPTRAAAERRSGRNREGVAAATREAEDDVWSLSEREHAALGIASLPRNLEGAVELMESSELVAETLGEHVFDFFLRNKRAEFDSYRREVTPWELRTPLPKL